MNARPPLRYRWAAQAAGCVGSFATAILTRGWHALACFTIAWMVGFVMFLVADEIRALWVERQDREGRP